eukprot:GEMP01055925.1.p1 GENE.GEMP01055925.1~~GEMP01055925.1.p1  ORF type:complete len:387 (+),score=58.38 GEMP01055925.1:135-1295(+)
MSIPAAAPRGWICTAGFATLAVVGNHLASEAEYDNLGGLTFACLSTNVLESVTREYARHERLLSLHRNLRSREGVCDTIFFLSTASQHEAFASAAAPIFQDTAKVILGCFSTAFRQWKLPVSDDPEWKLYQNIMNQQDRAALKTQCAAFFSNIGYTEKGCVQMAKWMIENSGDTAEAGYQLLEKSWHVEPQNVFKLWLFMPDHLENYFIDRHELERKAMERLEDDWKNEMAKIPRGEVVNPAWCASNLIFVGQVRKSLKASKNVTIKSPARRQLEQAATQVAIAVAVGLIWGLCRGSFRAWRKKIEIREFLMQHLWKTPVGTGLLVALQCAQPHILQKEYRYESAMDGIRGYAHDAFLVATFGGINWLCPYSVLWGITIPCCLEYA